MTLSNHNFPYRAHSIAGALGAALQQLAHPHPARELQEPLPFVTISRRAGSGGRTLAKRLAERLNALTGGGHKPDGDEWHAWDHELVEKVAKEHELPPALVETLEDGRRPWVQDFLVGLASAVAQQHPEEFKIYRRVAHTIRGLATVGHAIIVGRGGVFITRDMPGGVHVRLVASLADRIENAARRLDVSTAEATKWVKDVDHNREAFYRRHWPGKELTPETFTITLNTTGLTEEQMVAAVMPLIPGAWERLAAAGAFAAAAVGVQPADKGHKEKASCQCRDKAGGQAEAPATAEVHSIGDAPREAKRGTWHAGATR
jgi:cytidylate kinase